jgi:hypothetical protein
LGVVQVRSPDNQRAGAPSRQTKSTGLAQRWTSKEALRHAGEHMPCGQGKHKKSAKRLRFRHLTTASLGGWMSLMSSTRPDSSWWPSGSSSPDASYPLDSLRDASAGGSALSRSARGGGVSPSGGAGRFACLALIVSARQTHCLRAFQVGCCIWRRGGSCCPQHPSLPAMPGSVIMAWRTGSRSASNGAAASYQLWLYRYGQSESLPFQ